MIKFTLSLKGNWYYFRNKFYSSSFYSPEKINYSNSIYEVIRVVNKIPVFIEDHFQRFENSLKSLGIKPTVLLPELKKNIQELSERNTILSGNLRFELYISETHLDFALYQVPHSYPTEIQYTKGVSLKTYTIERLNPHIKQSAVNLNVRSEIAQLFQENDIYEVLLINHLNEVTEGSKSNIYFIDGTKIYSPPSEAILEGITRKRLVSLIKNSSYEFIEELIPLDDLSKFEACFLTGTSPKVLPVKQIDTVSFNPNHVTIRELMELFNRHMDEYCEGYK